MRSTRTPVARLRGRRRSLLATGLVAALALTATACAGSGDGKADASASASQAAAGDGKVSIPSDIADKLREHGIDVDDWASGGWQDWDKDKWLSAAKDLVNPVIEGLWKPERMRSAKEADKTVTTKDTAAGQGVSDPEPTPVEAEAEKTPYHENAAPVGKVFFDSPEGTMVCSGTVISDVNHPGKSNLVWTAGHCVHAGGEGGWCRNIVFVPAYNDLGKSEGGAGQRDSLADRSLRQLVGRLGHDVERVDRGWLGHGRCGRRVRLRRAACDARDRLDVAGGDRRRGTGRRLLRAVGDRGRRDGRLGYPAAAPYNGLKMFKCIDRPGRLSLSPSLPTMYRIGCTMTGGSSGGGWFRTVDGETKLVSNTSIGPTTNTWLAGPQLGPEAQALYENMSETYGGQ
ncbi:Secreted protein OS=Streptomyces aurantiogriseus OX=66870 GN=GCM10010251_45680 PE=4 SV=1 [Streptomyces aurantiogriseus]|uniref:Secreted protein n=1 Tax=Streptomyces aurantiogriseus TaxID=66870 RepID=A0A918CJI8_9ACTN|nr:hypothetical protein GCM10010251_45680 [Streptomyces aurantiogriseus]